MEYNSFITNFQSPQDLEEMEYLQTQGVGSNLDILLKEYKSSTDWTVPSDAKAGDIVFFMCAKSSIDYRHMAGILKQARESGDISLISLAENQYDLYKEYAGKILVVGSVNKTPQKRPAGYNYSGWGAEINNMVLLRKPIDISEFRAFISVSNTGAITKLKDSQYQSLMGVIEKNNPGFLASFSQTSQTVPDMDEIIENMTDEELEASCGNAVNGPAPTYTATTVLRKRDPYLPEKVKRNAQGICQLCEKPAPFQNKKGRPFLEAHHVIPLADNGPDIESNMVALCPNCHRKMHVVGDCADVEKLTQVCQ